jgi:hypothetical protein
MPLARNSCTTGAAAGFLRGSGLNVIIVPSPSGPVMLQYSSVTKASPEIILVDTPCSRICRVIRPASVW